MASIPIKAVRTVSGNQPLMDRYFEEAGQSFLDGVPVSLNGVDGGVEEWGGLTTVANIAGISQEAGSNLGTTGVPKQITFGSVVNQPYAVNIARPGANDGKIGLALPVQDSVFYGQVGPAQSTVPLDVGAEYGMTKDSDFHWYVDKTKTGADAVVQVIQLDSIIDTVRGVYFVILPSAAQLFTDPD